MPHRSPAASRRSSSCQIEAGSIFTEKPKSSGCSESIRVKRPDELRSLTMSKTTIKKSSQILPSSACLRDVEPLSAQGYSRGYVLDLQGRGPKVLTQTKRLQVLQGGVITTTYNSPFFNLFCHDTRADSGRRSSAGSLRTSISVML